MSSNTGEKETTEPTIELSSIQHVNEKTKNLNETTEKLSELHEATQEDKIVKVARHDPYPQQPSSYGQTPYYYEQRRVAGRPVYVQDEPLNVRDTPAYRSGGRSNRHQPDSVYVIVSDASILGFEDPKVRNAFVRKVYLLLCLQLSFTFGLILTCTLVRDIKYFMFTHYYLAYVGLVGMMVTFCTLACCHEVRRITPINYILFALCTFFFAIEFAFLSIIYTTYTIALAIGLTFVACVCITIFAIQTSWDITGCGVYLCVGLVVVFCFGLVASIISIFAYMPILHVIYAGLIGILFSFYLIYDTQQIVGGKRVELSQEEYIMGALQLYIDIMYIFYCFLQIIGFANR